MKYYWKWLVAICFMFVMSILNLDAGANLNNSWHQFNMFCCGLSTAGMGLAYIGFLIDKKNLELG